jgi:dimethylaniline monooxygenase (N-oxide forming)
MPGAAAPRRVAIIGAGAAGLCAAKYLLARGVEVIVFEAGSNIGGLWVYQNDNGLSMAYKSLHLNSEHAVTAYRDFPFPPGSALYPRHDQVRGYLEAYAQHFDLNRHIRFRSPVTAVEPLANRWRLRLGDTTQHDVDAVIVASGHQSEPAHPPWKDSFTGSYLHSNVYREPEPFRDQRVLVVGMGNSAVDIAADICTVTTSTTLSARSPVLVMPRMLFGVPTSRVLGKLEKRWMPWPLRRTIRELLVRIVYGRMEQWGFVTPKTRTHPTSHTTLMQHFVWGRISAKPGIESVQGREVRFTDGSSASYDSVIAGTGYRVNLPFLAPELRPLEGHQLALFLRVVHPRQRGLYFAGMFNVAGGGNIRMMDDQAQWISELICGDLGLPDSARMHAVMTEEQAFLQRNFPGSARYALELDPPFYRRQLARESERARKLAARGAASAGSAPATAEKGAGSVAA